MEYTELKALAEEYHEDALSHFWDEVNEMAYDDVSNDLDREQIYGMVADLLKN